MGFIRAAMASSLAQLTCVAAALAALAAQSATLSGSVIGDDGKPVPQATVFVYAAHLKQGYAVVCPTCWIDCGKHTETDEAGHFAIEGLNPDLKFRVLVAKDQYSAAQKGNLDPAQGPAGPIKLKLREKATDPRMLVHGRVIDADGAAVKGALIEPEGAFSAPANAVFGSVVGERLAVSNAAGEFQLATSEPFDQVLLNVSPRGLAPTVAMIETGERVSTVRVAAGATVMGRLLRKDGAPVPNVEMALAPRYQEGTEMALGEIRVGTDPSGRFAFTNVPPGHLWQLFPTDSVVPLNLAAQPVQCLTRADGEVVQVGKITLTKALTLKGRVVDSDGSYTAVSLDGVTTSDTRIARLGKDGSFEFPGVTPGPHRLMLSKSDALFQFGEPVLEVLMDRDQTVVFRAVGMRDKSE
ncbi:MAG TPA: hypothetical protein VGI93_09350 [Steroidobacteraceae bacterium]|jgi:protocatechuate 3,4-dioxygenase beta subunit